MADVLEFDPATEFQVLETFDFEEEIQRPEALRFYTLDEQLLDYVEKSMPEGKATRFQIQELHRERERLKDAYLSSIDPNFELRPKRVQTIPSWIHPIHSEFDYTKYKFETQWNPIMEERRIPNYYTRMILALPNPYNTKQDENPSITETTKTVSEQGTQLIALGNYERTKGIVNEDGSLSVVPLTIPNTQDDIRIQGYSLDKRPLDVPNPLSEHPFLSSSQPSKVITQEPFLDIFPSINAILTHGVPTTTDPYTEGQQYLKLYDVRFPDIPWELWRQRFPPVDSIETPPAPVSVSFPKADVKLPSENLKKVYSDFYPGINPYTWLMNQEDGGAFVPRMLLSKASDSGLLPVIPIGEIVEPQFPASTPEECLHIETFDSFLSSGIYRDKKCLPVSYIQHERQTLVSQGRNAWRESTEQDILKEYQLQLLKISRLALPEIEVKYEKHEAMEVPAVRKEVLLILGDQKRLDIDKVKDVSTLVQEIIPKDKVYLDAKGSFLVCEHTIELLKEPDIQSFYREWTFIESGYRVCKFCGEQINRDVFLAQDDFDQAGNVIISHDVLPSDIHRGESNVSNFTKSLVDLRGVFDLDKSKHIGRAILYLLLSLFQVVPLESQLLPVLTFMDGVSAALRSQKKATDETDGILGIVGMAILLQTHNPFLVPRRSFGSKKLKMSGYPRDTDETKQTPVINTILFVLQSTFESFPNTFTGPVATFMRALVSKTKSVRSTSISFLGKSVPKFKIQFEDAKQRFAAMPEDVQVEQLQLPLLVPSKMELGPTDLKVEEVAASCSAPRPLTYLESKLPPSITQDPLPLQSNLRPSTSSVGVVPRIFEIELSEIPTDSIRDRLKKGVPKEIKIPALTSFIDSEKDGIALLSLLSRILDLYKNSIPQNALKVYRKAVLYLQTRVNTSILRDSVRGLLYSFLAIVSEDEDRVKTLVLAVKQDIVLRLMLMKQEDAEREDQGLRARERELLKKRLREKNDAERDVIKMLLDIGIAPYIVTNKDREQFAQENEDTIVIESEEDRPEGEYDIIQGQDDDRNLEDNETGMRYNREEDYGNVGTQIAEETD